MEEVDAIIVHTLQTVGCDIDEDVISLSQFSTELIVEAAARCVKVMRPSLEVVYKLPPSMAARFRVGTVLAQAIADIGYRGDLGYQTFLYPSEADIRRVFMFLIEQMPKEASSSPTEEALSSSAMLRRKAAAEISRALQSPWTPSYCKREGICWRGKPRSWLRQGIKDTRAYTSHPIVIPTGASDLTKPLPKEIKLYYAETLPLVTAQVSSKQDLSASILEANALSYTAQQEWEAEWNHMGLASRLTPKDYLEQKRKRMLKRIGDQIQASVKQASATKATALDLNTLLDTAKDKNAKTKGSRFTHAEKLQFAQADEQTVAQLGVGEGPQLDTAEEQKQKQEQEVQQLQNDLRDLERQLEQLKLASKQMIASKQQIEEQHSVLESKTQEKQELFKVKKRTMDLLPDAENNIAKLQSLVESSSQRLVSLATQWEKHRVPLIEEYRLLQEVSKTSASETERKLEEIKELREKLKTIAADTKSKEELQKQLAEEYNRMAKNVNRSAYTRKILEIVANIKKQKDEIDKVLIDTRAIQKEINQLSGKLDRTFTVTDELIFKDAKKDDAVRKAYKYLAALHESFNHVIQTVESTGVILREIRDLEDQIENESKKKILANLEKITEDYVEMKKENTALIAKLKKQ